MAFGDAPAHLAVLDAVPADKAPDLNEEIPVGTEDETEIPDGDEDTEGDGDESGGEDDADGDADTDAEADADSDADADADEVVPDGGFKPTKDGKMPKELKDLLKANEANPKLCKLLKDQYFTNAKLMKMGKVGDIQRLTEAATTAGGVEKLLEIHQKFSEIGGEVGFQEMQDNLKAWQDVDQKWQNDPAALAEHLADADAGAFDAFVPTALNKYAQTNGAAYDHMMSGIMYQTLIQNGAWNNFNLLKQALATGNVEGAKQALAAIEGPLSGIRASAEKAPPVKQVDPKVKEYQQREQTQNQERTQRNQDDILTKNTAWMSPRVNTELSSILKGAEKKLSAKTLAGIEQDTKQEIWDTYLAKDAGFQKQRQALLARGDVEGSVRLYKQATEKHWATTVRKQAKAWGVVIPSKKQVQSDAAKAAQQNKGNTAAKGAAKGQTEQGWKRTTKYPKPEDVDRSKTSYEMRAKDQFVLKTGEKVQVVQ